MGQREKGRKVMKIGAIGGALVASAITLGMDYFFKETLQGTWRDAIANDISKLMSISMSPDHIIVYVMFAAILVLMAAIGAAFGILFAFLVYRFLSLLSP